MNFAKLNDKYYVLFSFPYKNEEVFVCRDKVNLLYSFFKFVDDDFIKIKSPALDKIFKPNTDPIVNDVQNNFRAKFSKADIEQHKSKVIDLIKKIISDFSAYTQKTIENNINSVVINIKKIGKTNIAALYDSRTNTITMDEIEINKMSDELLFHTLLHEMLHCASASFYPSEVGFRNNRVTSFKDGTLFNQYENTYFNEAYTELTAQNYHPISPRSYPLVTSLLYTILKFCDQDKVRQYYFTNDNLKLVQHLQDVFHQPQSEIQKLLFLFDVCEETFSKVLKTDRSILRETMLSSYTTLVNLISKMIIDKYRAENKNPKMLDFYPLFVNRLNTKLPKDIQNAINYCLHKSLGFFEYYSSNNFENKTDPMDYVMFPYFKKCFVESFTQRLPLPSSFPEKYKCFEIFQQVLSNNSYIGDKKGWYTKESVFRNLFNEKFNYLPKDENMLLHLTHQYLCLLNDFDFDITKYLNRDYVVAVLKKSPSIFRSLSVNNIYYVLDIQNDLPSQMQASEYFYVGIIKQLLKEKNQNSLEILSNYFNKIDVKTQNKMLYSSNFLAILEKSKLLDGENLEKFIYNAKLTASQNFTDEFTI